MKGEAQPAAPAVRALDDLLLDAKLSVPPPQPGTVSRRALIDEARASDRRVVAVTAPAGYGKSTFMGEWALGEDRRVAWVSLDRLDDDPAALLTVLAAAYERVSPESVDVATAVNSRGLQALGRAAPRLASAFRTTRVPFVLMLDDLHELRSPACHDVLEIVVSGIPRGSQLVAASRSEQPHLARLRAAGDTWELMANDLALDAAGASRIFAAANVKLSPALAATLTKQTEGWAVGLSLAARIAGDTNRVPAISGDDRSVADYLYRESLSYLSESERQFLRRTAVLDHLTAPLCDAVVGSSGTQDTLRSLEASGSFLMPLDRRREWYRYHALFREFLLGELSRVEPDFVPKLHLRAADWYEANGSSVIALEHLLNTTERDRCVQLLTQLIRPTYTTGHLSSLHRWLRTVGDTAIRDYPPLAVGAGWVAALTGQTLEAQRWAAMIDDASFDLVPIDGTASFDSGRAMLRALMCPAGPVQMLTDARFALAQEQPWGWRYAAMRLCAEAHLLTGEVDQAAVLFARASSEGASQSNPDGLVLSDAELALLDMDRGRWDEAAQRVERALAVIDEHQLHDYALCVLASVAGARLAVHQGNLQEANRQLTGAMRARPSLTFVLPWLAVRARLQLAKVYWALQDQTAARHLLREIDDILQQRPKLGVLVDEVSAFREASSSAPSAQAGGASPLTPAELRLLPYLQTHLTIREIAERVFVSRNTVNSEVGSIYRKLGVSSRADAVKRATAIGLLGG